MTQEQKNLELTRLTKQFEGLRPALAEAKAAHEEQVQKVANLRQALAKEEQAALVNPYDTLVQTEHELLARINRLKSEGAVLTKEEVAAGNDAEESEGAVLTKEEVAAGNDAEETEE